MTQIFFEGQHALDVDQSLDELLGLFVPTWSERSRSRCRRHNLRRISSQLTRNTALCSLGDLPEPTPQIHPSD